ncbi:tail fiber assembly protein [Serratia sp. IR-2025]
MFVACTAIEAEQCESAKLTEVSAKVYESIGANSQYVNGEVVQGEPRIVPLTQETMRKVLSSKMAEATARIQILQDAIDFGESTGDEKESIIGWKKYRIALSRIDLSAAPNIYWPSEP